MCVCTVIVISCVKQLIIIIVQLTSLHFIVLICNIDLGRSYYAVAL